MYKFDNKQYLLFDLIMNHKEISAFDDVLKQSHEYKLKPLYHESMMEAATNLKTNEKKMVKMIPLGFYHMDKQAFRWFPCILKGFIQKSFIENSKICDVFYNSGNTLDMIFNNEEIPLEEKYHAAIPYTLGLFHKYNVIRFEMDETGDLVYYLIDLGIENENFEKIRDDVQHTQFLYDLIGRDTPINK